MVMMIKTMNIPLEIIKKHLDKKLNIYKYKDCKDSKN
jgi:hypothetical protein